MVDFASEAAPWWEAAVGYEVSIRSFFDSDGDGVGDLEGIRSKLPYLAWLGVDIVWITPFYPSPGFDHGYDVSDFCEVDPLFGDVATLRSLVAEAHDLGLRVIIDVVPNHSSSHHPFFLDAKTGKGSAKRDWYLWNDPRPGGGPPNNWVSHFGGPAWTLDEASGQYYCHLFLPEQPDFNWRNPGVRAHFLDVLRFWFDTGIDGFRIDVAHTLLKDPEFRDNELVRPLDPGGSNWHIFNSYDHAHDVDQEDTPDLFVEWRELAAAHDGLLLAELGMSDPRRIARYPGRGVHLAFFLPPVWMTWKPASLIARLRSMHQADPDRVAWVLDNHDRSRSPTRYGGGEAGSERSLAVFTLLLGLGGVPFLYQGQELGLENGEIETADLQDPISTHDMGEGRDGARTAMPWSPGRGNGFTTGMGWLVAADRSPEETVAGQRETPGSFLQRVRALLAVRKSLPAMWTEPASWVDSGDDEVAVVRTPRTLVISNLASGPRVVDLPEGSWTARFDSRRGRAGAEVTGADLEVDSESALILAAD